MAVLKPISWSMVAILGNSAVVVGISPQAIPLAMMTVKNQFMGVFLSCLGMWLHLVAL